ncbi:YcaO-like family protein [Streptomyces sp. NPDC052101]|uniref:YcaO-like family protein n=1 Tax=Streptomyces sp. NPDC052101 TaxID=3155763 RepID=UPI003432B847
MTHSRGGPVTSPRAARTAPTTRSARPDWRPQIFGPFSVEPEVRFGRIAARSPLFNTTNSAGGDRVLIGSAAGADAAEVAVRGRGELLERMGNVLAGRATEAASALVATYAGLRRRGAPVLDPAAWSGPESREAHQLWVTARSLLSDAEVLVPAGLAFLQHRPPAGCTAPVRAGSTGLAAHPDRSAAVGHAAWEILERDLLRRSWQAPTVHPPAVHPVLGELTPPVRHVCENLGLRATALILPASGACTVAVCLHTPDHREQTFGARCGPHSDRARLLDRAAHEALMVRWSMGTPAARRARERLVLTGTPVSAVDHALWTYHGGQDALAHWLPDEPRTPWPPQAERLTPVDPVRLLTELTAQDVLAIETTPAALRDEGSAIVRLIAPGTHPLPSTTHPSSGVPPHPFG